MPKLLSLVIILAGLLRTYAAFAIGEPHLESMNELSLKAKYLELTKQFQINPFFRPLIIHSGESPNHLKGDIYAIVDAGYPAFNGAFSNQSQWCDALILNLNVKYCYQIKSPDGYSLTINLGKKYPQPLLDTYQIKFKSQDIIDTPQYFCVEYLANSGPLGTSGYRILLEAIPLDNNRTFLHFTYAYSFGFAARFAMQTYISTLGRNKVGFTVIGKKRDGQPIFIQGIRGIVERNAMRFYLAIDAYVATRNLPIEKQFKRSLEYWYGSSERYPIQLHEVELNEYLEMKYQEYERQQTQ
jgi:hypothetical protein